MFVNTYKSNVRKESLSYTSSKSGLDGFNIKFFVELIIYR